MPSSSHPCRALLRCVFVLCFALVFCPSRAALRQRTLQTATLGMQVLLHMRAIAVRNRDAPATGAQAAGALDRVRGAARGAHCPPLSLCSSGISSAAEQVCQKHICDLRLQLSETTKSSDFPHVNFAQVPDADLMSVAAQHSASESLPVFSFCFIADLIDTISSPCFTRDTTIQQI